MQSQEILELRLESIEFDLSEGSESKIKFFHFWFFYFVNNANYRFYKQLITRNFSFSNLFNSVIRFMNKVVREQQATLG
jgi:hypothetical protein